MVMETKKFKYNFKTYNLKNNNIIKIYYYNYNPSEIKLKIPKIIPPNNNNIKYLNNKKKDLNTKKLKKIEKLNFFFIILIKISNKFRASIKKKIKNNYQFYQIKNQLLKNNKLIKNCLIHKHSIYTIYKKNLYYINPQNNKLKLIISPPFYKKILEIAHRSIYHKLI